jgi:metal-responsive CopG/Arc/MetJ family transcriptional regulator
MGRFLVDVPAEDVRKLDEIAKREGKSRAAILREAVSNYLAVNRKEGFEQYFGLGMTILRRSGRTRLSCSMTMTTKNARII